MKHLLVVLLLCCSAVLCGCAGSTARTAALRPLAANWPAVLEDAELGVRARGDAMAAQVLGVPHESAAVLKQRRDFLAEYGRTLHLAAE